MGEVTKAPERCRNAARHAPRKPTHGEPGELQSCPTMANTLHPKLLWDPNFDPAQNRRSLAGCRAMFCQICPTSGQSQPKLQTWPKLTKHCPNDVNIGHALSELVGCSPRLASEFGPNIGSIAGQLLGNC